MNKYLIRIPIKSRIDISNLNIKDENIDISFFLLKQHAKTFYNYEANITLNESSLLKALNHAQYELITAIDLISAYTQSAIWLEESESHRIVYQINQTEEARKFIYFHRQ